MLLFSDGEFFFNEVEYRLKIKDIYIVYKIIFFLLIIFFKKLIKQNFIV